MQTKLHTIIETAAFFTLTVIISSLTMLGAAGIDPFESNAPQVQTVAKGDKQ